MKIRLLEQNDNLYEISSIYENSWKYAYKDIIQQDYLDSIPEGRWAKGINREGMRNLVVTDNNKYVGTAGFCRSRWEKYSDYGELVSIYFLPEYIGKGYGKHLLDRCLKELKEMGIRVALDESNEKLGYKLRQSQIKKIPFTLVIGDKEKEDNSVTYRIHGTQDQITVSLDEFKKLIKKSIDTKAKY